jgi:hypothetical protein
MRILGIVALGAALGGCASSAADITPAYVSPVAYQSYTCQQLALEAQSISTRAATLSGAQDSQRTKDGWDRGGGCRILAGGILCRRRQADGGGTVPNEGSDGRRRAGLDRKEVQYSVSGRAATRYLKKRE